MRTIPIYLFSFFTVLFLALSCASTKPEVQTETQAAYTEEVKKEIPDENGSKEIEEPGLEEKWGIRVLSIRRSANGYMLDFRYRVVDPEKASLLMNRKEKPYLIEQASGARFMVPNAPKVGPLRQTSVKPLRGRNYFILFANPGKYVSSGNKVTVVIGDFRAENLVVQ